MKPDVVFFGDNLPPKRRDSAADMVTSADSLLCIGSSLQVCLLTFFLSSLVRLWVSPRALLVVIANH